MDWEGIVPISIESGSIPDPAKDRSSRSSDRLRATGIPDFPSLWFRRRLLVDPSDDPETCSACLFISHLGALMDDALSVPPAVVEVVVGELKGVDV